MLRALTRPVAAVAAVAAASVVVVGLLLLLAFRLLGERSLLLILVGGMPPALVQLAMTAAVVVVAVLGGSLVGRRHRLLSGVVVVAVVITVAVLLTPSSSVGSRLVESSAAAERTTLRVAAWNIAKGTFGLEDVARGIDALDADVVCLSEAGSYHWLTDVDSARLPSLLEDRFTLVGTSEVRALVRRGVTVLSTTEHPLPPGPASRPLLVLQVQKSSLPSGVDVRADVDAGVVSVACLHLMPKLLFQSSSVDRGAAENGSWPEIAAAAWQQGRQLRDVVKALPRPLVVGGDFNNVAHGAIVGGLVELGLRDALRDAWGVDWGDGGAGPFTTTFSDALRGKRIDHLLVSDDVGTRDAHVVDLGGSDHRPVVVELVAR